MIGKVYGLYLANIENRDSPFLGLVYTCIYITERLLIDCKIFLNC